MKIINKRLYLFVILVALSLSGCMHPTHPTDQDLIDKFNTCESEFSELVDMIDDESQSTALNVKGKEERYGILVRKIGIRNVDLLSDGEVSDQTNFSFSNKIVKKIESVIRFEMSCHGFMMYKTAKGYLYSKAPLEAVKGSLDNISLQKVDIIRRKIKTNWYIYYERN